MITREVVNDIVRNVRQFGGDYRSTIADEMQIPEPERLTFKGVTNQEVVGYLQVHEQDLLDLVKAYEDVEENFWGDLLKGVSQ